MFIKDWMEGTTVLELIASAGGLALVLVVLFLLVRYVHPNITKFVRLMDLLIGTEADPKLGLPAKPGMIARLDDHSTRLAKIEKQVTPNHGTDKILAEEVRELRDMIEAHLKGRRRDSI